ncbi:helix-turn-helix domain-containing protein [Agrobacterium sp. 22117]
MQEPSTTGVTEIALSCGFNSSQYFSNAFDKRVGYSPSRCRRL